MTPRKINPYVKLALELGPIVLFFAGFRFLKDGTYQILGRDYSGFIVMTAIFVAVIVICTAILWRLTGHLSKMQMMLSLIHI